MDSTNEPKRNKKINKNIQNKQMILLKFSQNFIFIVSDDDDDDQ